MNIRVVGDGRGRPREERAHLGGYAPDPSGKTRVSTPGNPSPAPPARRRLGDLVSQVTVMAVNETEGAGLSGQGPRPWPVGARDRCAHARRRADVVPHHAGRRAGEGPVEGPSGGVLRSACRHLAVPDFSKASSARPLLARTARNLQALMARRRSPSRLPPVSRTMLRVHVTGGEPPRLMRPATA